MRSLLVAALVAATVLAGCSGNDATETPADPTFVAPTWPVWVHTVDGQLLDESLFPGDVPQMRQVNVTNRISGEPTVAISRTGTVFYPSIDFDSGVPEAQRLPTTIVFRSVDQGQTWEDASPHILQTVSTHPYSFDPYVYSDPTTGRVFTMDMGPHITCNKVSWSDDDGRTWLTRDGACPIPGANDHPTLFAGPKMIGQLPTIPGLPNIPGASYPNTIFLCTNQVADVQCSTSPDGGISWGPSQPVFVGVEAEQVSADATGLSWLCGSLTGHGHASFVDGTVYLGKAHCGKIMAGISRDGGISWETVIIADGIDHRTRGEHDVSIATDLNGTAYAFWIGGNGRTALLSYSTDQGRTWSVPANVTAPGVTAAKLPSIVAGAAGRVAFQYVGTTTPHGWDVHNVTANGTREFSDEYNATTWHAYVGVSMDGASASPVVATTTVNRADMPLKRGGCDGRCFGDVGGMYDFFDIDFDPRDGRLWTAITDVCSVECDGQGKDASAFQRSIGAVGRQSGGTFLLDEEFPER